MGKQKFSFRTYITDTLMLLAAWLLFFMVFRVFSYYCGQAPGWGLFKVLFLGISSDIIGFLPFWILWSVIQFFFQGSFISRYLPLAVSLFIAPFCFFNAVFIGWAHEPVDHSFINFIDEVPNLAASAVPLLPSWPLMVFMSLILLVLMAEIWLFGFNPELYKKKLSKIPVLSAAWGLIILLILSSAAYRMNAFNKSPDKHGQAITVNLAANELFFTWKQLVIQSEMNNRIGEGQEDKTKWVRRTLVQDQGLYRYLNDNYPLMKFNHSFSIIGKRKDIWKRDESVRPNIVMIFMESFRSHDIGAYGSDKGLTPKFDAIAEKGWLWENFYAAGVQTPRGALAALCSINSGLGESIQRSDPELPLRGLGEILKENGYRTEFYHNGGIAFDKKDRFFANLGFDLIWGMDELDPLQKYGQYGWGFPDVNFSELLAEKLNNYEEKEPLLLAAFTVSHHHPWITPDPELRIVEEKEGDEYSRFQNSMHYSDHALGKLFENLDEDVLNNTIFVITADTATPMGEHDDNFLLIHYLYEENLRIPFTIYAPGFIGEGQRFNEVASQVDITPTLLDMLDIKCANHIVGRSLLSVAEEPLAFFTNPYHHTWIGIRSGKYKYLYRFSGDLDYLYDLEADPGETVNLAGREKDAALKYRDIAMDTLNSLKDIYVKKNIWPKDGSPALTRMEKRTGK